MTIVEVASEAAPFSKTGGLGDVLGALPRELAKQGERVLLFLPRYSDMDASSLAMQRVSLQSTVQIGKKSLPIILDIAKDKRTKLEYYFVYHDDYFTRPGIYQNPNTGEDFPDNVERFVFFVQAVLAAVKELGVQPDVFHVHDWQAAMLPVYLKTNYSHDPVLSRARSVLTIHNMAYQGNFAAETFPALGLPESYFYATGPLEYYNRVNFLKAGILFADRITTVSKTYAQEIQSSPELGAGLDGVLRQRTQDLTGILNGVDYTIWSPSRDKLIPYTYYPANLSGKQKDKIELLHTLKLPHRSKAPLIGIISRLVEQKGLDLIANGADQLLSRDIQLLVLGSGEERYQKLFLDLQERYPDKVRVFIAFDTILSHRIEAAADLFLMPSRFEPCGLNQLYSLKYGTIPIVHKVGGLADTVIDYTESTGKGTGFVFSAYTAEAMLTAVDRAIAAFQRRKQWITLMKQGMKQNFSWDSSSRQYVQLFTDLKKS